METNDLINAGKRLLAAAKKAGATGVSVTLSSSHDKSVSVRNGETDNTTLSQASSFSITAFVGSRKGEAYSSSFAPEDIDRKAQEAVAMAKMMPEDEYARLARPDEWPCGNKELSQKISALDLVDPSAPPSLRELEEHALELDRVARAFPGISRSESTSFGYSTGVFVKMTSAGFVAVLPGTYYSKHTSVIAEKGALMKSSGDYHAARHFVDLRSNEECALRAGGYAVRALGGSLIPTEVMPVLFSNKVSGAMAKILFEALSGDLVYRKATFLSQLLLERVFSNEISIIEEPHLPRRIDSKFFDSECVATKPRTFVDRGVLTMWHTSIESAGKLGVAVTGHSSGASNLTLLPGLVSSRSLMRGISRGLFVTELMGHGANMATGDYSVGVEGFLIEHGEVTRPVSGVTIAGNLLAMWKTMLPADNLSDNAGTNAPSLLVEQMTVGGSS